MRNMYLLLTLASAATAAGCSMTGNYGCGAPDGVKCMSVEEVYQRSISGQLKETKSRPTDDPKKNEDSPIGNSTAHGSVMTAFTTYPVGMTPGTPLRKADRILRIWIAPWEDDEKDYNEQQYVHVLVTEGEWLLKENLRALESELDQ